MNSVALVLLGTALLPSVQEKTEGQPAATHVLRESVAAGKQTTSKLHLVVEGTYRDVGVPKAKTADGKPAEARPVQKIAGQALLEYPEVVLEVGNDGMAEKVVRFYADARAKFVQAKSENVRQMRAGVRYVVGDRKDGRFELWSPQGALTGDERELVEDVLDVTRLPGLLPLDPVAEGAVWKPAPDVVAALCDLDHVVTPDLSCKLASINADEAVIEVSGSAEGLSLGAEIKAEVTATVMYDRKQEMVVGVQWKQHESRGLGFVNPALEFDVALTIERGPSESKYLPADVAQRLPTAATDGVMMQYFEDASNAFAFHYDRNWHITTAHSQAAILRRIENGVPVGQLNIMTISESSAQKPLTPAEFQAMIQQQIGWTVEKIVKTEGLDVNPNCRIQLMAAYGKQGQQPLLYKHYLATATDGRQVLFSFVMNPAMEERMGDEDLELVSTIAFPERQATAAAPATLVK